MANRLEKNCYCKTCGRWFHFLGIAAHRAAHRSRKETCVITYTNGDTYRHNFGDDDEQESEAAVISYRDMTFCASNCTNEKCERHFGSEDRLKAESWWGGEDAPVAFADFSPNCEDYEYDGSE